LSQLGSGLDSYHWQTVANLAWFSAFTHVSTLAVLRGEDHFNKTITKLRILAMGILVIMLMGVSYSLGWITGTVYTYIGFHASMPSDFPALCLYRPGIPWSYSTLNSFSNLGPNEMVVTYNWLYVALTWAILLFGYLTRVLLLYFDNMSDVMDKITTLLCLDKLLTQVRRLGIPEIKSLESRLELMGRTWMRYRLYRSTYALKLAAKHVYTSTVWEVC
jgi:hypothetical protein